MNDKAKNRKLKKWVLVKGATIKISFKIPIAQYKIPGQSGTDKVNLIDKLNFHNELIPASF